MSNTTPTEFAPPFTFDQLLNRDEFHGRHIGPDAAAEAAMLKVIGVESRDTLIRQAIPATIFHEELLNLPAPSTEAEALAELKAIAGQNLQWRNYIGTGYANTADTAAQAGAWSVLGMD